MTYYVSYLSTTVPAVQLSVTVETHLESVSDTHVPSRRTYRHHIHIITTFQHDLDCIVSLHSRNTLSAVIKRILNICDLFLCDQVDAVPAIIRQ